MSIDAKIADGNYNGTWSRLKHAINNELGTTPNWYLSVAAARQYGTFNIQGNGYTITALAAALGIAIDDRTGITDTLYWTITDFEILLRLLFHRYLLLQACLFCCSRTERIEVLSSMKKFKFELISISVHYNGESTGDIFVSASERQSGYDHKRIQNACSQQGKGCREYSGLHVWYFIRPGGYAEHRRSSICHHAR